MLLIAQITTKSLTLYVCKYNPAIFNNYGDKVNYILSSGPADTIAAVYAARARQPATQRDYRHGGTTDHHRKWKLAWRSKTIDRSVIGAHANNETEIIFDHINKVDLQNRPFRLIRQRRIISMTR